MSEILDENYEVCNCLKVTIGQLKTAIKDNNLKTLREIQEFTKAGTDCRFCIFPEGDFGKVKKKVYCKEILNEVLNG